MSSTRSLQPTLETKIIGAIVFIVLVLAFIALYIYPDNTDIYFAWTIRPATTAILIGEGYLAGALFFVRVIFGKKWQPVQAGFFPITAFTVIMMAATLIHWDRFHQGTFLFYLWTTIYAITPFLVPFLWWRNHSKDPQAPEENDLIFSKGVRLALASLGILGIGVGLIAFIWPSFYISITPWKLTELTARIYSGWTVLASATFLSVAYYGRWSTTRILLQSFIFGQLLTILALPRIWNDLDLAKPMSYVFIGGLLASLLVCITLYVWTERKVRSRVVKQMPLV